MLAIDRVLNPGIIPNAGEIVEQDTASDSLVSAVLKLTLWRNDTSAQKHVRRIS